MVKKKKARQKITKDMMFSNIIKKYPETVEVFFEYDLGCVGCPMAVAETIEQGARAHGINVKKLVDELNKKIG